MTAVGEPVTLTEPKQAMRSTARFFDHEGDVTLLPGSRLVLLRDYPHKWDGTSAFWVVVEDEQGRRWWVDGDHWYDLDG